MNTDNQQKVEAGKFVGYTYKLYDNDSGDLLFEAKADAPDVMIYGINQEVVPGLITAMKGLSQGDRFSVTLPSAAAFGDRYEENIVSLDKSIFMRDGELAEEVIPDAELPMMTQEGFMIKGRVIEISKDKVKMDFNHPFAGKTVKYDGEIVEVRDATPEELQPSHSCGCGCNHNHSCDDDCCSGHNHENNCNSGCGCH